ncbi:hypothetical protein X943_001228 [Babesia divergens]|uniref:Mitochondrial distribution and morphology protein 35 n=1 Tax=Babesia divergens TaxID=32595 RepID=A0AAD9LI87_BABDI|nr:hypothetical protein X943_001228 [Babesia divergens]
MLSAKGDPQLKLDESNQGGCSNFKEAYQRCFDAWLKDEILKGQMTDKCKGPLIEYRACLKEHFTKRGDHDIVDVMEKFERQ